MEWEHAYSKCNYTRLCRVVCLLLVLLSDIQLHVYTCTSDLVCQARPYLTRRRVSFVCEGGSSSRLALT